MLSRRNFLRSGTLSALSAGLIVGVGRKVFSQGQSLDKQIDFAAPDSVRSEAGFYYSRTAFENALGTTFNTQDEHGREVNLTLISVKVLEVNPNSKVALTKSRPTDSFSLSFRAFGELPAAKSIFTLDHPVLGTFDLAMSVRELAFGEIATDAVINHLL